MSFLFGNRNRAARERMNNDPDMEQEQLPPGHPPVSSLTQKLETGAVCPMAKLTVINQSHRSTPGSAAIIADVGGLPAIRRFTENFYKKAFADPHLDQFIRSLDDPHGERFSSWIAEKLGAGSPWSQERRTRQIGVFAVHGHEIQTPHDRSSAHFNAWHSPKRHADVWGNHFNLTDCRLWMRLHFWAAREEGLLSHAAFADYYVRFIGHFVSVYERTAPPFARESMRWSADPENVKRYLDAGRAYAHRPHPPTHNPRSLPRANLCSAFHLTVTVVAILFASCRRSHARHHGHEPSRGTRFASRRGAVVLGLGFRHALAVRTAVKEMTVARYLLVS